MKTLKLILITLATSLLFVTGCGEKEITNPFDEGCPKELFTPSDFKAAMESNAVKLTWVQENMQINGYVVNRSENDGTLAEVARIDKATKTWTDTKVAGGTKYNYQLFAYAGANLSNALTTSLTTPALGATVTTVSAASDITAASVTLGGNVTDDGGATVSERGICYSTTNNPTTANSKVIMGNGKGVFSGTISGLAANTTYYAKAFATNSYGTAYGSEISFKTTQLLLATVTTTIATSITANSALLGGNITSDGNATVLERGVCYGTTENPTIANSKLIMGNGTGVFSNTVTGLTAGTTYYVRAYAINSQGTAYGAQISFPTTQLLLATVSTTNALNIASTSAVLGGNVSNDGGATVTERGVCYATTENPTTANSKLVMGNGTGAFSNTVTGLTAGTTYYVRAYAINSQGTAYGVQISFPTTTLSLATVTTSTSTSITGTSAVLGGNITNDGNSPITERGVCYATTQAPTTAGTKILIGTGTGTFSNTVTGLTDGTKYYARAYAINSKGTAYGDEINFTTTQISLATITTITAGNVGSTSAVLGGNVTSDGNSAVNERGVCYAITQNPTTGNTKLAVGSGTGTFNITVSGLKGSTIYYARAYAVNGKGTAYGEQITFTTSKLITLASLSTTSPTEITQTTATVGGNITDDGGDVITERGVCYKISDMGGAAVITNTKVKIGSGVGLFSTTIIGLAPNTVYSLRAYAYNSAGLAYGPEIKLTTLGNLPIVSTRDAVNILETTAVLAGTASSDEGSAITERGISAARTIPNPTIDINKNLSGSGLGTFTIAFSKLIPNTTYYFRAFATNKNGTAYGESKTFKTLDAYYAGFESGWPTGWSGNWTVSSDTPDEGFYCLKSTSADQTVEFKTNITNASGGQISFYHKSDGGGYSSMVLGGYVFNNYDVKTEFYIDGILIETIKDEEWTIHSYTIAAGDHIFKWINKGGGYRGSDNNNFIDYVICPK